MAVNDVQVPAITTNLYDPIVTTQTAKEWYLYWHQSGDRINALNEMVTYGSSAARLDPSQVPYGALYVESDRSGIIYQNQGGVWHYIAGTMWATISPDQRPTNLGANDAGFEFRSTDTNPLLGGHTWIWSGSMWVEVTPNRYGTHASRLALTPAGTWNGMIWSETDRSEVLYQLQSGVWHFLAGTMWGTISPDQRPTDLGANDAGFHFRGTDQAREFIWSGTVWVEVGLANYQVNGTLIGSRATLNLIAGTRTTITGVDNSGANRVDVTVSVAGIATQASPSRALGTVYQNTNATALFVLVTVRLQFVGGYAAIAAYTDPSASPGTIVAQAANYAAGPDIAVPVFFIVLPGNYYRVTIGAGTVTLFNWTEWF